MIRRAAMAGRFYPDSKESINAQIESFEYDDVEPVGAFGVAYPVILGLPLRRPE